MDQLDDSKFDNSDKFFEFLKLNNDKFFVKNNEIDLMQSFMKG